MTDGYSQDDRLADMAEDLWECYDPVREAEIDFAERLLQEPSLSAEERNR